MAYFLGLLQSLAIIGLSKAAGITHTSGDAGQPTLTQPPLPAKRRLRP